MKITIVEKVHMTLEQFADEHNLEMELVEQDRG